MNNFESLRQLAEGFIRHKRSLGYVYGTHEHYLMNYVRHSEIVSPASQIPDRSTVTSYLDTFSTSPGSLYNSTAVLREFGRHLMRLGIVEAYVIPPKNNPALETEPPYFFTEKEIQRFFEVCDAVEPHPNYLGRELVLPAMFRLLYCCGLRCKEARTLRTEDMHIDECYLDVLQSKGSKSRRIFISAELAEYLSAYDISVNRLFPTRMYFFPNHKDNSCYENDFISNNFNRFWKKAFPSFVRTTRPRAYDFRHHFVWANLNRWAADGLDVNVMLPYIARYMGHQHIKSTLYYFRFVPDFFQTYESMAKPSESVLPEVPCEE